MEKTVLITGAEGFIGKNLASRLALMPEVKLLRFDVSSPAGALEEYAKEADFVFHLAGVNRPKDAAEFTAGNVGLTQQLLGLLEEAGRKTPVLITSSAQVGNGSDYGNSKQQAEQALLAYAQKTGAAVYPFRLPGVFGKWSRPNYNTVVATFCHNIARGLPIQVNNPAHKLELVYIDDVVDCFLAAMEGHSEEDPACPGFCAVNPVHSLTLGQLAQTLEGFREGRKTLAVPNVGDALSRKLYATYLSFLPEDGFAYPLTMHKDERGSFTEFLRSPERGQVSVNVSAPGVTKGNHWHHTKNEKFLVVKGRGVIRFRRLGEETVYEYPVSGEELTVVDIPTGYTHNIENLGEDEMVTVMWASEPFNLEKPDTYFERV